MGIILKLYLLFFKLGFLSFGGGYAMLGLIYTEGSQAVGLTATEFADLAALELLASGPIAINAATYVGYIKGGLLGSIAATAGVCTPAVILSLLVYYFLNKFRESKGMEGFLTAIKIACGGLLLNTAITIGYDIFVIEGIYTGTASINISGFILLAVCLTAMLKFKVDPIKMILVSAVYGMLFMR